MNSLLEQLKHLFAAPFIQRVTESGPQGVTRKLQENALMIGGPPPPGCASEQSSPNLPQHRHAPVLPCPQRALKRFPELFHVPGPLIGGAWRTLLRRVFGTAVDPFHPFPRFPEAGWHRISYRRGALGG